MNRALATVALCLASSVALPVSSAEVPLHTIEVRLSPRSGALHVVDEVQLAGLEHFRFRLAPWLAVVNLAIDGRPVRAMRVERGYRVELPDRRHHVLRFELSGTVPPHDTPDALASSGGDGAYLPGFAAWIPLASHARMLYRLTVNVPADVRAVATGKFVAEHSDNEGYSATFRTERPGEPPSLFAGPYAIRERREGNVRLRTYLHAELTTLADDYLQSAGRFIKRYAAVIGDYPYADFHIVSAPLPVGLGFPNLTYVGRRVMPLPFMRTRSLAHEVLHNWWGNGIAVDYASGNWAEGLTTYMADYALAGEQGGERAREMRVQWLRDYAALPPERDMPAVDFTAKQHQADQVVGYNKVAFVFHMLKAEIGGAAFEAGLRRFWAQHAFGTAGWPALQTAFEHASGRRLDWFFEQWLRRAGAPRLNLGKSDVTQAAATYTTSIEIRQSPPYYRLTLPVSVATRDGAATQVAAVAGAATTLDVVTDSPPLAAHVDPAADVFRRLTPEETPPILRDVTLHPAAITLIEGGEPAYGESARALAARLLDTAPRFGSLAEAREAGVPVLLIATRGDAAGMLAALEVEAPDLPDTPYSEAAWTARRKDGMPVLTVTAPTADALQSLMRPLPHYGGRSYVLFDNGKAVRKGVWPIDRSPLRRVLTSPP